MNVLAIGSHPDDIEFGCGGSLCKLVAQGHDVFMLVLTKGEMGGDPSDRRLEQEKSAESIGVKELFWGDYRDTRMPTYDNVISGIEKIAKEVKPNFVYVHYGKDTHQDHRHVSSSAVVATRNVPNVVFYEGPTTYGFDPTVFVNLENHMEGKVNCLSCHESQVMRTNIDDRSILDIAMSTASFRGTQCRVSHAEGFRPLRMLAFQ